jgi:hypothetical protein
MREIVAYRAANVVFVVKQSRTADVAVMFMMSIHRYGL